MKLCVLASGSSGNCIYIGCGNISFLVDAGIGIRQLCERLAAAGSSLDEVRAVLITHEHEDHIRGLPALCRRGGIPIYANRHTAEALMNKGTPPEAFVFFRSGVPFSIGSVDVHPFQVPHDARDPVGFIISSNGCRVGIATDLGSAPESVKGFLRGCRAVVIESNHDDELLWNGTRPLSLKVRILSESGHLSNETAAALVAEVASEELRDIFLAHISNECNRPEEAVASVEKALRDSGYGHVAVRLTYPDRPSEIVEYALSL